MIKGKSKKEYFKEYKKNYIPPYNIKCIICNKIFYVEKYRRKKARFCSYECYWKFLKGKPNIILKKYGQTRLGDRNSFFGKRHTPKTKKLISKSRKGKCHGELNPNWRDNASLEEYGKAFGRKIRRQVRFRDKYICQLCGCPEIESIRKLSVHHIDYDKKNNKMSNLISLCNPCHLKTNHSRSSWTAYFIEESCKTEHGFFITGVDKK